MSLDHGHRPIRKADPARPESLATMRVWECAWGLRLSFQSKLCKEALQSKLCRSICFDLPQLRWTKTTTPPKSGELERQKSRWRIWGLARSNVWDLSHGFRTWKCLSNHPAPVESKPKPLRGCPFTTCRGSDLLHHPAKATPFPSNMGQDHVTEFTPPSLRSQKDCKTLTRRRHQSA